VDDGERVGWGDKGKMDGRFFGVTKIVIEHRQCEGIR